MIFFKCFKLISSFFEIFLKTFLSYTGALDAKASIGISPTTLPLNFNVRLFVLVVFPIITKSKSHLSKIFFAFSSFPSSRIISILSWLSDSIISYGVIFSSLQGTLSNSISIPNSPFDAISTLDEVKPAAPMSWIDMIDLSFINSKHASIKSFSVKGSPTCTVGFFASEFSSNSAEAIEAP